MKYLFRISAAACASFAFASHAQNAPQLADPTDPAIVGAPLLYQSAFQNYVSMPTTMPAPDQVWRAANDEAARLKGHAGQIKESPGTAPANKHEGHRMQQSGKE